jgi:hypothetical protein
VARRAAAAVASLKRWRGMLRRAKRRRVSGSVSKSASMKISTVSSLRRLVSILRQEYISEAISGESR